jgi:hypothetical protein
MPVSPEPRTEGSTSRCRRTRPPRVRAIGGERGHRLQGRARRRGVVGPAQRLAVDRHNTAVGAVGRLECVQDLLETRLEGLGIEQPEDPGKGVVARHAVLQIQKLPEQILPVDREVRELRAGLRPADRRRQRDRQHLQQIVPRRSARARIRQIRKTRLEPGQGPPPSDIRVPHPNRYRRFTKPLIRQMRFPCRTGRSALAFDRPERQN